MTTRDPRVDTYIENAAPFARPLLERLRRDMHAACAELDESIRWARPVFMHKGRLIAGMAAFKQHASFGYWRGGEVVGEPRNDGMGQFGQLRSLDDLPSSADIAEQVRRAIALVETDVPKPTRARTPRPALEMPDVMRDALDAHPVARRHFDAFSPSQRRDYIEWIVEAKRDDTRARRLAQAIEWLAEGKPRHWKHLGG
ncbi:YdeI/OmpD-associated family protein [Lysobacter sp. HA35]